MKASQTQQTIQVQRSQSSVFWIIDFQVCNEFVDEYQKTRDYVEGNRRFEWRRQLYSTTDCLHAALQSLKPFCRNQMSPKRDSLTVCYCTNCHVSQFTCEVPSARICSKKRPKMLRDVTSSRRLRYLRLPCSPRLIGVKKPSSYTREKRTTS